jgi:Zn-dependent protease
MTSDVTLGPIRLRLELVPIIAGIAFVSSPSLALSFLLAIFVHELGHSLVARKLGITTPKIILQVTGGGSYIREVSEPRRRILVLLAGPAASTFLSAVALVARSEDLFYAATVWSVYQLMPFPPLDGGQLLRIVLARRIESATLAWRLGWILGISIAVTFVLIDFGNLQPVVLLTGMALVLGRAESGYVRHLDAYAAWKRGDHRTVVNLANRVPEYLPPEDKRTLFELALRSAIELEDVRAIQSFSDHLPPYSPVVIAAAEWLLGRREGYGAKLAQRALDALDHEQVKLTSREDRERWAELVFRFARWEAIELRGDSALGLLERAVELGFDDTDRLELDGDLLVLRGLPRWQAILRRIQERR